MGPGRGIDPKLADLSQMGLRRRERRVDPGVHGEHLTPRHDRLVEALSERGRLQGIASEGS